MASASNSGKVVPRLPSGNRMKQFLEETWVELRYKVTWPDLKTQLVKSTAVVLAVVVIVSLFTFFLNRFFDFILLHTLFTGSSVPQ